MPLYAYRCAACDHEFQTLVRADDTPECPACGSVDLARRLSLIAKPAAGGDVGEASCSSFDAPGGCGACPALADCG
ncbi:MAG: zinc ribbon domain-containing protein [Methylocystaceae bacterium]|nr:MAG: zinc ribbon domain-containing protein [Methylocystaceae bacterium]